MASIESRSRYVVSVQNRDDLTQTFAFNRTAALKAFIADLKKQGYKPKLSRTNAAPCSQRLGQALHRRSATAQRKRHPKAHRRLTPRAL